MLHFSDFIVRKWPSITLILGGSGLENITPLMDFNRTYLDQLAQWQVLGILAIQLFLHRQ
jgi:hypothetical protein